MWRGRRAGCRRRAPGMAGGWGSPSGGRRLRTRRAEPTMSSKLYLLLISYIFVSPSLGPTMSSKISLLLLSFNSLSLLYLLFSFTLLFTGMAGGWGFPSFGRRLRTRRAEPTMSSKLYLLILSFIYLSLSYFSFFFYLLLFLSYFHNN